MKRQTVRSLPSAAKNKPSQLDRFRAAARELDTDESEERFREVVKKVVSAPYAKHDASKGKKLKSK